MLVTLPVPNHFSSAGSGSIYYLQFVHPLNVTFLSLDRENPGEYLARLSNLTVLECNEIELFHPTVLSQFISGDLGKLTELHCNLTRFISTDYRPDAEQLKYLRPFHDRLRNIRHGRKENDLDERIDKNFYKRVYESFKFESVREGLSIYIHGVLLKLDKLKFDDYQFDQPLLQMHNHNKMVNQLDLRPCYSVSTTNYLDAHRHFLPEEPVRFKIFDWLYPSMRHAVIESDPQDQAIQPDEVLQFLSSCRCWLSLTFKLSRLETNFYNKLTKLTESCLYVERIAIFETGQFLHTIDLEFLTQFKYLTFFETNAVTIKKMLNLLFFITRAEQRFVFYLLNEIWYRFAFAKAIGRADWAMMFESFALNADPVPAIHWPDLELFNRSDLFELFDHPDAPDISLLNKHWTPLTEPQLRHMMETRSESGWRMDRLKIATRQCV